ILEILRSIYGASADALAPKIAELISNFQASPSIRSRGRGRSPLPLGAEDVLLITYGDQVAAPGESPLRTLHDFLTTHAATSISGVHVLPFYPSSSDDGFSVIDYQRVDPALGDWPDIDALSRNFDLMFDAVFNHLSARSAWFEGFLRDDEKFRDYFITVSGNPDLSKVVRPRALPLLTEFQTNRGFEKVWTTFSADQVDLNFRNPEVLLEVLHALLFYASRGARFIRLDAIAYLWKEIGTACIHLPQTHGVIQLFRAVLDAVAPEILLITETNVPHTDNISYFGDGTNEAQLVYNFALPPLIVHSIQTGSAIALTRWASSLRLSSNQVAFFNFLASHDGIGLNPVRGILPETDIEAMVQQTLARGGFVSYKHNADGSKSPYEMNISFFDALSDPRGAESLQQQIDRFLAAHAVLLALQGMPAIYFHSMFGSRSDRAGAESSGIPRRINRQKFERSNLEKELAESGSLRARVLDSLKRLLHARRQEAAFAPAAPQKILSLHEQVFAVRRTGPNGETVICLQNLADRHVPIHSDAFAEVFGQASWTDLLRTETGRMGFLETKSLAPYEVVWWKSQKVRSA
ncbi:MAG: alpha-amylase family glycosyl hydrolase, partial [Verrucomicrobiota bacterium]